MYMVVYTSDKVIYVLYMLHFVANSAPVGAAFGQGSGDIFLDDLGCTGSEKRLIDCPHNGIGIHSCTHAEDAGVMCQRKC